VLYRSWRLGRSAVEAFAEDYACVIQGLLDLYEAGFDVHWLQWAQRLQDTMIDRFWDGDRGAVFNSQAGDPAIVLRLKEDYDGAEPAASSVAAMNLFRLGAVLDRDITASESYHSRGRSCIAAFQGQLAQTPQALPQLLCAVELALSSPRHVILAGDKNAEDFRALAGVLDERLGHRYPVVAADGGTGQQWLAVSAPWMADMKPVNGRAAAYVCEDFSCQGPVTEPAALRALLFPEHKAPES